MPGSSTFLTDRIASLEARITAYETAMELFAANGLQMEYRLDTGQQNIRVERADPDVLQTVRDRMINQHAVLCVRAGLSPGVLQVRPSR